MQVACAGEAAPACSPDQAVGRERVAERVARVASERAAAERALPLAPQLQRLHCQRARQALQPGHLQSVQSMLLNTWKAAGDVNPGLTSLPRHLWLPERLL